MKRGLVRRSPTAGARGVGSSEVLVRHRIVASPEVLGFAAKKQALLGTFVTPEPM